MISLIAQKSSSIKNPIKKMVLAFFSVCLLIKENYPMKIVSEHKTVPSLKSLSTNAMINNLLKQNKEMLHINYNKLPLDLKEYIEETINKPLFKKNRTYLFYLARVRKVKNCLYLGADLNICDNDGNTPLHYAIKKKDSL